MTPSRPCLSPNSALRSCRRHCSWPLSTFHWSTSQVIRDLESPASPLRLSSNGPGGCILQWALNLQISFPVSRVSDSQTTLIPCLTEVGHSCPILLSTTISTTLAPAPAQVDLTPYGGPLISSGVYGWCPASIYHDRISYPSSPGPSVAETPTKRPTRELPISSLRCPTKPCALFGRAADHTQPNTHYFLQRSTLRKFPVPTLPKRPSASRSATDYGAAPEFRAVATPI